MPNGVYNEKEEKRLRSLFSSFSFFFSCTHVGFCGCTHTLINAYADCPCMQRHFDICTLLLTGVEMAELLYMYTRRID